MKNKTNQIHEENVKMNISLPKQVFETLKANAQKDYIKTATYAKQILMKNLEEGNKRVNHSSTFNETNV